MNPTQLAGLAAALLLAGQAGADPATAAPTLLSTTAPIANAYDSYLAAANSLDNAAIAAIGTPVDDPPSPADSRILAANSRALELFRQGLRSTFAKPDVRADMSYFAKMRALARLLVVDSHAAAARGDWNAAAQGGVQCLRFGIDLPHGGGTADLTVGVECEQLGRAAIARALPHLPPLQAVALARHLNDITARAVAYPDVLKTEQRDGLRLLLDLFKDKNWRRTEKSDMTSDQLTAAYMKASQLAIANASLPYARAKTGVAQPADPVLQLVLIPFCATDPARLGNDTSRFIYLRGRALDSLFVAEASLIAFHDVQHYYPQTLRELVPFFFTAIPTDPFATGQSVQYRQTDRTYLLYSVGPDGIDDNGRSIDDPAARPLAERHRVFPTSRGDIVAGVNTR